MAYDDYLYRNSPARRAPESRGQRATGISNFNNKFGLGSQGAQASLRQASAAGAGRGFTQGGQGAFDARGNRLSVPRAGGNVMQARSLADAVQNPQARRVAATAPKPVVQDNPAETNIDYNTKPALDPQAQAAKNKQIEADRRDIVRRMQNSNLDLAGVRQQYLDQYGFDIYDDGLMTDDLDLSIYGYGVGG